MSHVPSRVRRSVRQKTSSWLYSMGLHLTLLVFLACLMLPVAPSPTGPLRLDLRLAAKRPLVPEVRLAASIPKPTPSVPVSLLGHSAAWKAPELTLADLSVSHANSPVPEGVPADASTAASPSELPFGGTTFFGIPATGQRFVYLLDMSTSMRRRTPGGRTRFETAAAELVRSVSHLQEHQSFAVILFCYRTLWLTGSPRLLPATPAHKRRLQSWLYHIRVSPGTDPRLGFAEGLRLRPDALFLLSDGEFNGRRKNVPGLPGNPTAESLIRRYRQPTTRIHTIAFAAEGNRVRLANIAAASGGTFLFYDQAAR